jgi:hypothetical protein
MLIGYKDHLQNHNLRTENEDVNCQKHDRHTGMKCISFLRRQLPWKDLEGNRFPTPNPVLKRNILTQAQFCTYFGVDFGSLYYDF